MLRRVFSTLIATLVVTAAEPPATDGTIDSDSFLYDQKAGVFHYQGHVRLRYPGVFDLDCADLQIRLLPDTNKLDRIVASTNVVMTMVQAPSTNTADLLLKPGSTNRAYAALAVYNGTNNTVTLTGSSEFGQPWVEAAEGSFKADVITYDRANDRFLGTGNFRMVVKPSALPNGGPLAPRAPAPGLP
jgi:lipopolysaccharide export system protein LptA